MRLEENRNQRFASFQIKRIATGDFSRVLYPPLPAAADELLTVWGNNCEGINKKKENVDLIMSEIENVRNETLLLLESLD